MSQRVFDFTPAEAEVVVSRLLVSLHQAIDASFPDARPASQRFAKTAFVGHDEPTLTQLIPTELSKDVDPVLTMSEGLDENLAESPLQPAKPKALDYRSGEQHQDSEKNSEKNASRWTQSRSMSVKQTWIGILSLVLVALIAYLLSLD